MKSDLKKISIFISCFILFSIASAYLVFAYRSSNMEKLHLDNNVSLALQAISKENTIQKTVATTEVKKVELRKTVYENLTMDELVRKLNKSLNSNLSGKGELIASYSLEKGVDPVLATAIMLHETGCKWNCSYLVKKCNNVGGIKGSPGCAGMSSYQRFNSLDAGIKFFISNLKTNYYNKGLNTPEKLQGKYSGNSPGWATNINNYMKEIKNK